MKASNSCAYPSTLNAVKTDKNINYYFSSFSNTFVLQERALATFIAKTKCVVFKKIS